MEMNPGTPFYFSPTFARLPSLEPHPLIQVVQMPQDQDMIQSQVFELYFTDPYFADQSTLHRQQQFLSHIDCLPHNNYLILSVSLIFLILHSISSVEDDHQVTLLHHLNVKRQAEFQFIHHGR